MSCIYLFLLGTINTDVFKVTATLVYIYFLIFIDIYYDRRLLKEA